MDLAWQTAGSGDGEVVVEQCSDRFWDGDLKHTEDFGIAFPTVERVLSSDLSPPP